MINIEKIGCDLLLFKRIHFKDEECKEFLQADRWGKNIKGSQFVSPSYCNLSSGFKDVQFTGFCDKHGADIYVGDILRARVHRLPYGFGTPQSINDKRLHFATCVVVNMLGDLDYQKGDWKRIRKPMGLEKHSRCPYMPRRLRSFGEQGIKLKDVERIGDIFESPGLFKQEK